MTEVPDTGPDRETAEPDETASQRPIRIVIADDHAVVRRGLRLVLDSEEGFEVVAEASDSTARARYVRGHHPTCSCST